MSHLPNRAEHPRDHGMAERQRRDDPLPPALSIKITMNNVTKWLVPAIHTDMGFEELQEQVDHQILTCIVGCEDDSGVLVRHVKRWSTILVFIGQEPIPLEKLDSDRDLWMRALNTALADLEERVTRDLEKNGAFGQLPKMEKSARGGSVAPENGWVQKEDQEEDDGPPAKRQRTD
ncbi:hypothetical protein CONLIGDRAFT_684326 [Coniochaeta ligniaria NRRL 30616]|uniref:Uncharacterized protein n=1 Tax=Coniochaeta ligniaria NRRL 30616 TaxID=1408157 RepID=A0A1J7J7M5_9PEZI|nr:hypothetical protein CONLIGDRAFT_684326 [Coniochaeta ligniaria NRRL 30616]